jgi:hypothetical protein
MLRSPVRPVTLATLALSAILGCSSGGSDTPPPPPPPPPDGPQIAGCPVLPATSPWNRDVSADIVDPHSADYLARMSPGAALHLDLGTTELDYGIPFVIVPASQPLATITYGTDGHDYSDESDPGPFPIPLDAPIEGAATPGGPGPAGGDRHVIAIRQGTCELFELYNAVRTSGGFRVSASARWDLRNGTTRPAGWTSADAAGLPIFPGLLRYEEVAAGEIAHALRFTVPLAQAAYVAPANHCGGNEELTLPPYGLRVRLKASFDDSVYTGDALVLVRAMERYGLLFADQGSAWYVTGTTDPRWANTLDQLRRHPIHGSDFEVLATGPVTACWEAPAWP